jgi:hypothetical protein
MVKNSRLNEVLVEKFKKRAEAYSEILDCMDYIHPDTHIDNKALRSYLVSIASICVRAAVDLT